MSDYRVTSGLMARLIEAVPEDDYEAISDRLFDADSKLHITYDGALIYSTDIDMSSYEFEISFGNKLTTEEFAQKCEREGLCIDISSVQPYTSLWYDGADSPMSTTSLQDFLNANQKD
ncbi:TPA: hypothetical protein NV937_000818 [Escherichia coli]|uniref:Uncharacterized protein n=1 Tax=Escherichia phage SP27 TaxID=2495557 RepID=A0A5A4U8J6_9CAUD|nr:hypothetical protein [Escherichia coli]QDF13929.1 hypothetical protein vBEcoMphAPEC6_gp304c [Escherichia phage vB_EcoM_phAPEC6]BBM62081.1 hypothetical protein EO157G_4920 [Escherichia phage SP27]EFJ0711800.1 hypothetical protein [Escherichia coli]MDI1143772.1 hypothetical protein [Escherichia coli]GCJ79969.1 hypothetical protein BvCmsB5655_03194 [Escherichia coli]